MKIISVIISILFTIVILAMLGFVVYSIYGFIKNRIKKNKKEKQNQDSNNV